MKKQAHFLEYIYCHLLLIFLVSRVGFLIYNRQAEDFSVWDAFNVCKTGLLSQDVFVAALLLVIPLVVAWNALLHQGVRLRAWLTPYYIIMGLCVAAIVIADAVMYEFWQFKLHSVVLSYAASPEGTSNSVSTSFLLTRGLTGVALILLTIVPCIMLTPKRLEGTDGNKMWFRNLSIIWGFLTVLGVTNVRVGDAYRDVPLFLNHAAVNPVLGFVSSFPTSEYYADQFDYMDEGSREETFNNLYPTNTEDVTDTLLNTRTPNVLVIFMESFGGKFVKEIGGIPDVAPNWSRLIPEGIFWENYYSNSFRTDRGTVSTFSGWLSYPSAGLMKETEYHDVLPSMAKSLNAADYETSFLYSGPMTNMGKRDYLAGMEFVHLLDHTAYKPEELSSTWGANDSTSAMKAYHLIAEKDSTEKWFMVYQTLSSHEPWEVPYHRLEDKKLNAFAYTDQCVGDLVDSLKTLPQWKDMLVIMIPDHGFLYEQNFQDPEFFHSPMLWLGGAIREPRRMDVLMNQSDIAATLLSQMGISHRDYPWSRNVLSRNYTYPFVYCNFPAGIMLRDSTGVSMYDLTADETTVEQPADNGARIRRGLSILQTSHDLLDKMK